jgi:hypothetical protein
MKQSLTNSRSRDGRGLYYYLRDIHLTFFKGFEERVGRVCPFKRAARGVWLILLGGVNDILFGRWLHVRGFGMGVCQIVSLGLLAGQPDTIGRRSHSVRRRGGGGEQEEN